MFFTTIITYLDYITIIFAFFAMMASGYNFFARRKELKEIEIYIVIDGVKKLIPIKIARKNVTREEIKGIMSDFDKDHNYTINYLKSSKFMNDIFLVQKGKKNDLTIEILSQDKFDLDDRDFYNI
ncbi:hypothetical protein [Campylobacter ureolyticus]|uniref:hypothetical protein n=1 Tax=Campylobacter ureolyticus TaxID=827 RepID=UPI0022B43CC9|nr:hypothetical protein [Campylobacter ureolyticus]MCZ6158078.1 hypothetical protein [Campylobacter ureolyticus]